MAGGCRGGRRWQAVRRGGVGEAGAGDRVRGARCGVDVGGGRCELIMAVSEARSEVKNGYGEV